MSGYLLIESRDPFESKGFAQHCELALTLLGEGNSVTLFLVENAVLAARAAAKARDLDKLAKAGVRVLADKFALHERGIDARQVIAAVEPAELNALLAHLADGAKTLWN
ncbi:MAG TPA: DsrE family protein [Steroidobacteraceae bacterium]|jgi:sulfur relay (sulfurtransferase) complex TusBCD TusD component (DsrE family)|nr:DsrE family protein [Steroidobacteraceae bacterium]